MHPARSGDRNIVGGDRHLPDRGIGFKRRGDRYTTDRWNVAVDTGPGPGPPPFDPTQVAGLQGWWKADSLALSDGAPVASWTDSSTHGRNATPGVAPTFVLNPLSMGKPAVHFTSGTVLRFTAIPIATPAGYTIIAVTFRASGQILNVMSANSGAPAPEGLDCGAGNAVYMSDAGGRVAATIQSNRWSVYTQTSDYAGIYHGFENGMPLTLSGAGGWPAVNHYDQIGMRGDGDSGDGYIAELLFYDHILSDTDRLSVEKYLGDKYAISVAGVVGTIPGLKGWWAADKITAGSLLRGAVKKELVKTVLKGALITTIPIGPDSMSAPADGAAVSTWPDASGNGKNFVSTYGSPPTYVAAGVNGKPIVRFLADAFHVLDCNPFLLNQPDTIIVVAKKPNAATSGVLIDNSLSDNIHRHLLNIAPNTGFFGASAYFNQVNFTSPIVIQDTVNHQGAFHVFVGIFNGGSSSLLVDGTLTASGDIGSASLNSIRMQCDMAGGELSEIDMAEVLIYDHALTTTERQNLEAYLGTKYGITIAPPPPPFDPSTIAGLKGWWAANAITGLNDGDPISSWPDASGLGNNATMTGTNRPVFKTNVLVRDVKLSRLLPLLVSTGGVEGGATGDNVEAFTLGLPVVRFSSAGQSKLDLLSAISGNWPWTAFVVFKTPGFAQALYSLTGNDAGAAPRTPFCRGGPIFLWAIDRNTYWQYNSPTTAFHVVSANALASGSMRVKVDGVTQTEIATGALSVTGDFSRIGYEPVTPEYSDGDIAEILVYSASLSPTDVSNVEAYLKAKYGL